MSAMVKLDVSGIIYGSVTTLMDRLILYSFYRYNLLVLKYFLLTVAFSECDMYFRDHTIVNKIRMLRKVFDTVYSCV
jgi:hypothetical protein